MSLQRPARDEQSTPDQQTNACESGWVSILEHSGLKPQFPPAKTGESRYAVLAARNQPDNDLHAAEPGSGEHGGVASSPSHHLAPACGAALFKSVSSATNVPDSARPSSSIWK